MTFSKFGRFLTALVATAALGLGMTACGGGTIGYIWVTSTYYNQINGYKIDDYTGNLTAILDQPFADAGTNPATIVLKPGGRFVYVINSGTGEVNTPNSGTLQANGTISNGYTPPAGANIAQYSVGGSGVLTPELNFFSQGFHPVWATFDTTGNYLYVVDKYSPAYCAAAPCIDSQLTGSHGQLPQDLNGSITAFSVAADTGRLTLVQNTAILKNNIPQNYFEVGQTPGMIQTAGACLYTLSPSTIYPYSVNSSNGQLTVVTTGSYVFTAPAGGVTPVLTSINSGSTFTYLTDTANNMIYSLQSSGGCTLTPVAGSQTTNLSGTSNPVNSVTAPSGNFLYVINQDFSPSLSGPVIANSTISAFNINNLGQLVTLADTPNNPYPVGSGPVCLAIDPTHQYLYTSNGNDATITGKVVRQDRGYLSDLGRGSVFPLAKNPTCLVISGNVY